MSGPSPSSVSSTAGPDPAVSRWVRWLCWSAIALEGYDLVVLGVVIPVLREDPGFALNPASATVVTTLGLLGVMVGALTVGPVSDVFGRRRTVVVCTVVFSVLGAACALATGAVSLGILRFLAGIPLGGVLPVALAMVAEYAPAKRGNSSTTVLMTGYHAGAVASALLGVLVIESLGWEIMFIAGAVPALALVPVMLAKLPADSAAAPAATTTRSPAAERRNPVRGLFSDGRGRATIAFWVASFMGLLLVYGLNTWLPTIMREAGYALGAALVLLLVLNVGAVVGLLIGGSVADRIGVRTATIGWFLAGAVFLAALSIRLPGIGVYVAVLLAGIFVFSSQVLVYSWVGRYYPAHVRGTALGSASGVGRLGAISGPAITGVLLTAGLAYPWGFYFFAVVAVLGAVAVTFVGAPAADAAPAGSAPAPGSDASETSRAPESAS